MRRGAKLGVPSKWRISQRERTARTCSGDDDGDSDGDAVFIGAFVGKLVQHDTASFYAASPFSFF